MDPSGDDVDQFELIEQKGPWPFTSRRAYRRPDGSLVVRESRHHRKSMELDLFLTWTKNERITVSPLLGFYKPDEFAVDGGTQLGDDDTNLYVQIVVALGF